MSGNSTVSLTLQIKGQQASNELKKINSDQLIAVKKINAEQQKLAPIQAGQFAIAKKIAVELRTQGQALTVQKREAVALDAVRKLGIRTEKQINNEIKQTRSTYAQLSVLQRQGVVSAKDMERAYAAMNTRVSQLNRELGKTVSTEKQIQQAQNNNMMGGRTGLLQKGAAVGGAAIAAGYVLQRPVRDAMQYEKDLAQLSITAYDNPSDRKTGQNTLRSIITGTAKQYGQTTDDTLTGLNSLVASGKYKGKTNAETEKLLKTALGAAAEAAQASGGDILDFAQLSVAAKLKGLNEREYMGYAVQAGKEGNFETRDLAKHLATQSGMLPSDPANKNRLASQLMAFNQVAMSTAGSTDQAGNNVTNLLAKMNAESTKKTFKKDYGIDLDAEYLKGATTGKTRFDVFGGALTKAMQQDSRYKKLLSDLGKTSNSDEKQQILMSQQSVLEQSALSNVLPDMQALAGGVALVSRWDEFQRITQANLDKGSQSLSEDSATMRDTASYGVNQLAVTKKNSEFEAMRGFNDVLGDTSIKLSKYADKYPALSTAVAGATIAIGALGAAAGVAAIGGAFGGGGKGMLGGALGRGAASAGGYGLAAAVGGVAGYGIGTGIRYGYMKTEAGQNFDDRLGETITKTLAFLGNDDAQATLELNAQYGQMIAEQQQQTQKIEEQTQFSRELSVKLSTLINVTQQNKPVINLGGGSLMEQISHHARSEEKRHGFDLLSFGQK